MTNITELEKKQREEYDRQFSGMEIDENMWPIADYWLTKQREAIKEAFESTRVEEETLTKYDEDHIELPDYKDGFNQAIAEHTKNEELFWKEGV